MSDYRYNVIDHNGIQCLHVIIEHEAGDDLNGMSHTYIPVDDIMQSFAQHGIATKQTVQGFASSILQVSQNVVNEINALEELHPDDLPADKAKDCCKVSWSALGTLSMCARLSSTRKALKRHDRHEEADE